MVKTEAVIRSILGAVRADIRPLACAVDIAADLMFTQHICMDDIRIGQVYQEAAGRIPNRKGKPSSPGAVSRRIQRLANQCWDALVARDLVREYLGSSLQDIRSPRDVILYLAFYVRLDTPFFIAIRQQPALLF